MSIIIILRVGHAQWGDCNDCRGTMNCCWSFPLGIFLAAFVTILGIVALVVLMVLAIPVGILWIFIAICTCGGSDAGDGFKAVEKAFDTVSGSYFRLATLALQPFSYDFTQDNRSA